MCVHACKSACLCAHMSGCVSVHVRVAAGPFVCGFLYAQDGGGWGCCAGFWMRLELCQRMDGVFFSAFPQHIVENTYTPPKESSECRFLGFSRSWMEAGKNMELLIGLTSPYC